MRSHKGLVPIFPIFILLPVTPVVAHGLPTSIVRADVSAESRLNRAGNGGRDQGRSPRKPAVNPSDADIQQAVSVIERADGYREILQAIEEYEDILSSNRVVELADAYLRDPALDANRRGLLILERQLALDCRLHGPAEAARRLSVRLIAGNALAADSPQQLASVLEKFSPLASQMDAQLVRESLDTSGNTWPKMLLPLMEGLGRDWPERGALAAATRMAEAATRAAAETATQTPAPNRGETITGHWRSTRIVFDQASDEHLVLRPDGTAETWTVTASGRTATTRGRWKAQSAALSVDWEDGRRWSQSFTFYKGQLVFPNVANRRQFWDLID